MEMILLLSCSLAILMTANVHGAAVEAPLDVISLDDLSQGDRDFLTYLEEEGIRKKRSEDLLGLVKAKIAQGIKSKIGDVASASKHISSSSSKDHHHYGPPPESYDEKGFDFWDLQKSILNTLVQAVKAIKGGILAVKGHLIKGGGYIITAKGKLISAKGEAITSMGKHIAASAMLSPRPGHSGHSGHSAPGPEYGPPSSSGFSAPSGHAVEYHPGHHAPPPHSGYSDHKFPPSYEAYKDHLPRGAHHGILVLKKIPKGHKDKHNGNGGLHIPSDKHKPDFKPEEPSAPSISFLPDVKSIFSASSHKEHGEIHSQPPSEHPHFEHLHSEHPHFEHMHSEHVDSEHAYSKHPHSEHPHSEHSHSEHAYSKHPHSEHLHSEYPHSEHPHSEHLHSEHPHSEHSHSEHAYAKHPHSESLHSEQLNNEKPLPHYESPPTYYGTPPTPHDVPTHIDTSFAYYKAPPQYDQPSTHQQAPLSLDQPFNHYGALNGNAASNHLNPPATSYGTPIEIPENNFQDYYKEFNNLQLTHYSNGPQPTALSSNIQPQLPKLETYNPIKLPSFDNPTPLTASLSNTAPQKTPPNLGLQQLPSYPVDLSTNFGKQHNNPFKYSVHEPDLDFSASEIVLPGQESSRGAKNLHSILDSLMKNPDILKKLAHNIIQDIQPSQTRSVSRQKRPKTYDLGRSRRLRPRHPIKI